MPDRRHWKSAILGRPSSWRCQSLSVTDLPRCVPQSDIHRLSCSSPSCCLRWCCLICGRNIRGFWLFPETRERGSMRVMRLAVICARELMPVFLDQNIGVALLCWRAVTYQTATRQQPHFLWKFVVLRQRGSESAYRLRAPMYRDLVRIREGAPLEASLLGPSADVVSVRQAASRRETSQALSSTLLKCQRDTC